MNLPTDPAAFRAYAAGYDIYVRSAGGYKIDAQLLGPGNVLWDLGTGMSAGEVRRALYERVSTHPSYRVIEVTLDNLMNATIEAAKGPLSDMVGRVPTIQDMNTLLGLLTLLNKENEYPPFKDWRPVVRPDDNY